MTTAMIPDAEFGCKYWAFISYSHHDEHWARWLHHALETYRIPNRLAQRLARNEEPSTDRIYPVFRDRDDLSGGFDLSQRIRAALEQSRFLIVICSPHAASSRYVQQEIDVFENLGRENRVLCLIVSGEPGASRLPESMLQECLPAPVRTRRTPAGDLVHCEPMAADVRKAKDGTTNAKLKIVAEMLGVPFDDLKKRDERRRLKRRIQIAAVTAAFSIVLGMMYLLALDAGVNAPGEATLRRLSDRYGVSLLRRVPSEADVKAKALNLRKRLADRLIAARRDAWFVTSFKPEDNSGSDVWIHSQIAFALLSLPDDELKGRQDIALLLAKPFTDELKFEWAGVKYGWLAGKGEASPISPPAFWTAMGLAVAFGRHAYPLNMTEEAHKCIAYVQEALAQYQPNGTAGWNLFPNQQVPTEHNVYAATLAMMALLETKRANLPWHGSIDQRDRLIQQTFDWLVNQFDPQADPPGWKAGGTSLNTTSEGLSLQVYGRLLDARSEAGLTIPPQILREIPRRVADLADRTLGFPSSSGEFSSIIAFDGEKPQRVRETINFPWYSWAPDLAVRWLQSSEGRAAQIEERVAVKRALAHLVINLGDEAVAKALERWTFVAAETLYGLSAVVSLEGSSRDSP